MSRAQMLKRWGVLLAGLAAMAFAGSPPDAPPAVRGLSVDEFEVGPNAGKEAPIQAPIDVLWDSRGRKLHARSLILTEVGDAVDLRIRRAPGGYPDGPVTGTSSAGTVPGGIHWDALTADGWRQVCGIEGMARESPSPPPTAGSHPGWLTFYTYAEGHDDRIRRMIIDDTGAAALGGGGFGGDGLPPPRYGFHLYGGGLRVQAVASPSAPTLSLVGPAGTTRYEYRLVARDSKAHETPPGPPAVIENGPARLDGDHAISLQWDRTEGAESYVVLRNGQRLDLVFRGEGTRKTFVDRGYPAVAHQPRSRNGTADAAVDGTLTVGQALFTPGVCAPEPISGERHDFEPAGLEACATLVLRAAAPARLTGLKADTTEGRWLLLVNAGPSVVTLANNAAGSLPAHRFRTGTGQDLALTADQTLLLVHAAGSWRCPSLSAR